MKAKIQRDGCIGCGQCAAICPEVFQMADDGLAEVYVETVTEGLEDLVTEAKDSCPVAVISAE